MDIIREASRLAALLDLGLIQTSDVIHWADASISRYERPDHSLIELSLCDVSKQRDVHRRLTTLVGGFDIWLTLDDVVPAIIEKCKEDQEYSWVAIKWLYGIVASKGYNAPERYKFILSAEADFDLVECGIFRFETVYSEFIESLNRTLSPSLGE
ncbi:hypothetical protein [Nibricoccus sp. IMCC34717]|uniref:hypothetical protein n=1 Tax=Nibricoccus sp. IMCC34717 TaxID=3034021 RepID=UPI00384C2801